MQIRSEAKKQYEEKLAACRAAENTSEEAWMKAEAELAIARSVLIAAEEQFPTAKEMRRAESLLRLRNRGLDV